MTCMQSQTRVECLATALKELTPQQLGLIETLVDVFRQPFLCLERNGSSDLIDDGILRDFGDVLRMHHCFSREALSKDRFEYALEKTLVLGGKSAALASSRTNRGHDITIDGVPCSLKTQADKSIREDSIHISKFMELGKGHWSASVSDLIGLRDQFFHHMQAYERIFTLRCLSRDAQKWRYELVEIPKNLLQEAADGELSICRESKQKPKPGYCEVKDAEGSLKFQLYFDGGTERKLQIKLLRKDLCVVHAQWEFASNREAK